MVKKSILIFIVFLAFLLRVYKFTEVPPSLYWDEASIAYNSYSLNQTGKDEWGYVYPASIKSFGDYKLPLYVYTVAVSEKIFGLNEFAVRFPSAVAGTLSVLWIFLLLEEFIKYLKKGKIPGKVLEKLPFTGALLMAVSPWAIQFSRAGFEANLSAMLTLLGLWTFFLAVRRDMRLLFISGIAFVGSVYAYYSATVVSFVLLMFLVVIFRRVVLKNWKIVVVSGVLSFILLIPFLRAYIFSPTGMTRVNSESVTNEKGSVVTNFINNYVANFSTDYLFFKGDQQGRHSVKKLGELYIWELPAVLLGIYLLVREKKIIAILPLLIVLAAAVPPAVTRVSPHALRGLFSETGWAMLSALGLSYLLIQFNRMLKLLIILFVCACFYLYLHVYYFHYPIAFAADWQDGSKQAVTYLKRIDKNYDQVFITYDLSPVYLQLYLPYSPALLQASGHNLKRMGKYTFADMTKAPVKDHPELKSLMLAPSWMGSTTLKEIGAVYMSNGDLAFRVYEY